jgi:diaminopropionate ammonia-lyase
MIVHNSRVTVQAYPAALQQILSIASAQESRRWLASWERISPQPTPLYELPGLAQQLGVAHIAIKDESVRSPLASFKALGAPIALVRLVRRLWPQHQFDMATLWAGGYAALLADFTVISATDGNHGRALAAAAQSLGCGCVIVIHANVSVEREQAIAAYGAQIIRISGNYDDSVVESARLAAANGWHVVSDTSYAGYEIIPGDVMQGYSIIADEVVAQTQSQPTACPYTHVFLQGGVGGFAAGIASYLWEFFGLVRPRMIVVEPEQADCLYQSAIIGAPANATGSVDSLMAGLACGETSPLAWQILQPCIDDFMTVSDESAAHAMRCLAYPTAHDIPIVSGESGAAGLAGLQTVLGDVAVAQSLGIDATSRILLISTEGATAPSVYHECVGESADAVVARQP